MCRIKTKIHISKNPETVWKCLTDFEAYPQWNPFLTKIERLSDKELKVEFESKTIFTSRILKNDPPQEFRWVGKLGGVNWLFKGEHYFILIPEKRGTTFTHGEHFTGILAWILWPFIRKQIEGNFIAMNEAMKKRLENS